jgi:phosphoglycerate-specific signal transduction histidine kinase
LPNPPREGQGPAAIEGDDAVRLADALFQPLTAASNFMGAARLLLRSNGVNAGPLAAQNLEHAEVQIARAGAICRQLVERLK